MTNTKSLMIIILGIGLIICLMVGLFVFVFFKPSFKSLFLPPSKITIENNKVSLVFSKETFNLIKIKDKTKCSCSSDEYL